MIYISKKIEKKIYCNFFKKRGILFSFFNFNFFQNKNKKFLKKYLLEVGLLKKKDYE